MLGDDVPHEEKLDKEEPAVSPPAVEEKPAEEPRADPPADPEPARDEIAETPNPLEDRIRRLEDLLAAIQAQPPTPPSPPIPELPPMRVPSMNVSRSWILFELYAESRSIVRMYVDPRYSLGWMTRLLVPLLIAGLVLSKLMVEKIPFIGWLLDLIIFIVLLYALIKVLSREATRYRMTSPDLPMAWRL